MFTNTVKRAIDMMRENGVDADMKKTDFDWGTEYVIKVRNEKAFNKITALSNS